MAITSKKPILPFTLLLIYIPIFCFGHRKILHQPFFPPENIPATLPPSPTPQKQPKYPFSSTQTFFPLSVSPPSLPFPPPPPLENFPATFPANISDLPLLIHSSKPISPKFIILAISLAILSFVSLSLVAATFFFRHKKNKSKKIEKIKIESCRLVPEKTHFSDKSSPENSAISNISGEFLYLGTLQGVNENFNKKNNSNSSSNNNMNFDKKCFTGHAASSGGEYRRLSSPELRPLPPLPRHQPFSREFSDHEDEENEMFFSPNLMSPNNNNDNNNNTSNENNNVGHDFGTNSMLCLPVPERMLNLGSNSFLSSMKYPMSSRSISVESMNPSLNQKQAKMECISITRKNIVFPKRPPPPPPPIPPKRFWDMFEPMRERHVEEDDSESGLKKLKPLHWDKVRASSDRAMVWDQIKSSSFQLNEEMIETLFMVNDPSSSSRENTQPSAYMKLKQEIRVLDPQKSQNIAILLRALNVTADEVCEALVDGTTDTLSTELLESLLKMAPSENEELKLKESKSDSPSKLCPAEKFLKPILDIPYAFQRVDVMLYVANFDSEIEYLKRSFETIKAACDELKKSKMFQKLLDTVLQTGNRMNVGTKRGDARSFKLDTLLKLVDVKGTDGKTTLLHFVVQEVSRDEGSKLANTNPEPFLEGKIEFLKLGLHVVSGLSMELDNVKKAADMDLDVLRDEVAKLSHGISKVKEILKLNISEERFLESMNEFLNRAEGEMATLRSLESESSCLVKEITEYFHGDSGMETQRFRIFIVVRDFISVLDGVCKEVGKVNEWSFIGSGSQYPFPVNSSIQPIFPEFVPRNLDSNSDDDKISL